MTNTNVARMDFQSWTGLHTYQQYYLFYVKANRHQFTAAPRIADYYREVKTSLEYYLNARQGHFCPFNTNKKCQNTKCHIF